MLHELWGGWEFECACGECEKFRADAYDDAIAQAIRAGWLIIRGSGGDKYRCPKCKGEEGK